MKLKDLLMETQLYVNGIDFITTSKIFTATKKQTMQVVSTIVNMPKNSVYQKINGSDETVTTSIGNNAKEAISKASVGDWIACGSSGENWVIKGADFKNLYKIQGDTAHPIQKKAFIKIKTNKIPLVWKNSWNETKEIPANTEYYLMANDVNDLKTFNWININPMNIKSFNETY